jgi:hypothetical protein
MLKIQVTGEDIANGKPDDCESCPIALAMKRAIPDLDWIEVDGDAQWGTTDGGFGTRFPEVAKNFIRAFDSGDPVKPFEFECEPRVKYYGYCDEDD